MPLALTGSPALARELRLGSRLGGLLGPVRAAAPRSMGLPQFAGLAQVGSSALPAAAGPASNSRRSLGLRLGLPLSCQSGLAPLSGVASSAAAGR